VTSAERRTKNAEAQRLYRERHREEVREKNAERMRQLREDRKLGFKPEQEKKVECVCIGCGTAFFVLCRAYAEQRRWCSTACSNRRYVGKEIERFWGYVDRSAGPEACWPWTGGSDFKDGRGRFWLNGTNEYASRIVWVFVYGPIPEDIHVLHKCDNPPCCNPVHLFLGTLSDNTQDMLAKGRGRYGPNRPGAQE
jgi:hypothetical protein